jgi:hypothetical protein
MGLQRLGPPEEIILKLKNAYPVQHFIETGTFKGDTSSWASRFFHTVSTIENSDTLFRQAKEKYSHISNIHFYFGDTRTKLKEIISEMNSAGIFWLDAHWSGEKTYGERDECPLLDELEIINSSRSDHIVLIDDARLFLSPPPLPHGFDNWPDITAVLDALQNNRNKKYIVIADDVILAVPIEMRPIVALYYQERNTRLWQGHTSSEFRAGLRLIHKAIKNKLGLVKS